MLGNGVGPTPVPPAAWKKHMGPGQVLNLALPGETTEQTLWRLERGLMDQLSPRVVVIGVGANNLVAVERNGVPVAAVAKGIQAAIAAVRSRWPEAAVAVIEPMLMGRPTRTQRENIAALHAAIAALPHTPGVTVFDPRGSLADDAGVILADRSGYGGLKLNEAGREELVAALAQALKGQL